MSRIRLAGVTLMLVLAAAGAARAQTAVLQTGVHVRLPGLGQGIIAHRTPDTLFVLLKNGTPLSLPLRTLASIDIRGEKDRAAGALRGGIIGGGIGLVFGVIAVAAGDSAGCSTDYWGGEYNCQRAANAGDAALAGVGGALVGAGIGALIGRRSWYTLRLPAAEVSRVSMLPGRRLAFAVTVRSPPR